MSKTFVSLAVCASLACGMTAVTSSAQAKPGGCLKYGVAGAVAGHAAGRHGVKGFLAGCAAGMYRRHLYNKQMSDQKKLGGPAKAPMPAGGAPAGAAPAGAK